MSITSVRKAIARPAYNSRLWHGTPQSRPSNYFVLTLQSCNLGMIDLIKQLDIAIIKTQEYNTKHRIVATSYSAYIQ